MLLLLSLPPTDLEILYTAVDSACAGKCSLSKNVTFIGSDAPKPVYEYIKLKYTDTSLSCTTRVNVSDARIVYRNRLWNVERVASFKALISGCGSLLSVKGSYKDRIPVSDLDAVKVQGVSPSKNPRGGPLELLVSAAVVFGVLYAFYTIEGM